MLKTVNVYQCSCEKCGNVWNAKDTSVPSTCSKCRSVKWNTDAEPLAEDLATQIKSLSIGERLELFAKFELCCGMNRGECICFEEEIAIPVPSDHQERLERARAALANMGHPKALDSFVAHEEEWRFTAEPVWWDETNTPYRRQWKGVDKPIYRVVEVDEGNHEKVVNIRQ